MIIIIIIVLIVIVIVIVKVLIIIVIIVKGRLECLRNNQIAGKTHSLTGAIPPVGGIGGAAHRRSCVPFPRAPRAVVCTQKMGTGAPIPGLVSTSGTGASTTTAGKTVCVVLPWLRTCLHTLRGTI